MTLVLAGCGDEATGPQVPEDVTFAPTLGIELARMTRLESGVYVETIEEGTGTARIAATDRVILDYTLWLPEGELLQGPSRLPPYLATGFIPGFTEGILGMRVGETRRIVVPSALGYAGSPPGGSGIPKHSVLVFEVRLVSLS